MQHLDRRTRESVLAVLVSATTVDDGPTPEQRLLIDLVAAHVLGLDGVDPGPIEPGDAAGAIAAPELRRLVGEGLVTLELMRHPGSAALVGRVDGYLDALGYDGPDQLLVRDAVAAERERVIADWSRTRTQSVSTPAPSVDEGELLGRVAAMGACAPGTLGRSFTDFIERHGFSYPVAHLSLIGHDFAHVLTGYEPVPEGELALQAFLVSAAGGGQHASGLLASLLLYEVGLLPFDGIDPKTEVLGRPGAAELFADAITRGVPVTTDVQALDHFALADRDLLELRAELGIPAPVPGPFTFVI